MMTKRIYLVHIENEPKLSLKMSKIRVKKSALPPAVVVSGDRSFFVRVGSWTWPRGYDTKYEAECAAYRFNRLNGLDNRGRL